MLSAASDAQLVVPSDTDQVRLFMFYVLFGGDVRRVAQVSRHEDEVIERLAHDFNWKAKLSGRGALDTEEGKEAERVLCRTTNYVSASRLERVFANLIDALDSDPAFARQFCTSTDEEGKKTFSTKNLVELAKGLEIVANVKYRALGDKQAQQADTTGTQSAAEFSIQVYQKLAKRFDQNEQVDTVLEVEGVVDAPRVQPAPTP